MFQAIMGGLQMAQGLGQFFGASSAQKKQQRMMQRMMADRAARIAEAKGEYDKSRRGLLAENRAAMKAQLGAARGTLGPALMASTASANMMRRVYGDFARRAAEIGRNTAAGKADLAMLSPYDIVDASTIGAGEGAKWGALGNAIQGVAGFAGGLGSLFGPSDPYNGGTVTGAGGQQYATGFNEGTNSYMSMPTSGVMPGQSGSAAWAPGKTLSPTFGGFDSSGYGPQFLG